MKDVLIYGLKRSGTALVKYLQNTMNLYVYDDNKEAIREFQNEYSKNYKFVVVENISDCKVKFNLAIISPAIPLDNPNILLLKQRKIKVYNELDYASKYFKSKIVAITGTNGKSTVATLIYKIFREKSANCVLAGNIGSPLMEYVNVCDKNTLISLETSSFQLEDLKFLSPKISVFLNIQPDHLLRHKNFENYFGAKKNIFKYQGKKDYAIINYDDENLRKIPIKSKVYYFSLKHKVVGAYLYKNGLYFSDGKMSEKLLEVKDLKIIGNHNVANALASICAGKLLGIENNYIINAIKFFTGLEHRYEVVAVKKDVTYINDSKATNVAAACNAIENSKQNLHILLGGSDKGENYDMLFSSTSSEKIKCAYIYGATKKAIIESARSYNVKYIRCKNMKDALLHATENAVIGETVLLSPACASFDEFENYEQRGEVFKQLVREFDE